MVWLLRDIPNSCSTSVRTFPADIRRSFLSMRWINRSLVVVVFRFRPRPHKFPIHFVRLYLLMISRTVSRGSNVFAAIPRWESPLWKCLTTSARRSLLCSFFFRAIIEQTSTLEMDKGSSFSRNNRAKAAWSNIIIVIVYLQNSTFRRSMSSLSRKYSNCTDEFDRRTYK